LTNRSTEFTGIFYNNALKSKIKEDNQFCYNLLPKEILQFLNPKGGPVLLKTELPTGEKIPKNAIDLVTKIVYALMQDNSKLEIAVLAKFIVTVKSFQRALSGNYRNLLIETVDKVQGLTTDVTIFVIPNTSVFYSLDQRLFNVATSRAKRHTIIICDKNILDNPHINNEVKVYLEKLDSEFSFYFDGNNITLDCPPSTPSIEKQPVVSTEKKNSPTILGYVDLSKFELPKKEIKKDKENIYIIDTNVFVDQPDIISRIDKQYQIVLSAKVIDELDYLKVSLTEEQKKNVHKALRQINESIDKRGIKMDTADLTLLPDDFNKKSPDNFILSVALKYKAENPIMLTSDNGLQIKAKGLGLTTITLREFLKQKKYI
jgi:rRNA-processing protein FCF1